MARLLRQFATWVRRYVAPIAISLAAVGLAIWLYDLLHLGSYEFKIQQARSASLAPASASDKIVVITVGPSDSLHYDQVSSEGVVNHRHYADLIAGMKKAGARSLVFDIKWRPSPNPADDAAVANALRTASPLRVTFLAKGDDYVLDEKTPLGRQYAFERPAFLKDPLPPGVEVGQGELIDTGDTAGAIPLLIKDRNTGVKYQHIALCAFRQLFDIAPSEVEDLEASDAVVVGQTSIQAGVAREMKVEWLHKGEKIPDLTLVEAFDKLNEQDGAFFRDKVVLLGVSGDRIRETVVGPMRGTMIVANALNTLLRGERSRPIRLDGRVDYLWSFVLALVATLGLASRKRSWRLGGPALALVALIAMPYLLVIKGQRDLETVEPALALALAWLGALAVRSWRPNWYPFAEAVPIEGTVMFVDVAGSTALVAKLGPSDARKVLSQLLDKGSKVVEAHGGEVIRDDGDGLLCFFPRSLEREHACDCLDSVEPLRKAAAQISMARDIELKLTFGIEAGLVARDFRSIHGLTVHKAARLQAACRELQVDTLVGPAAKALCEHRWTLIQLAPMSLRGIEGSTEVYRLTP